MRALGLVLVTASLALGAGGVAYRPQPEAQLEAAALSPADDEQRICAVRPAEAPLRHARIAPPAVERRVVSLGTRGFNYSRPGDPVPSEVRPPSGAAAAPLD